MPALVLVAAIAIFGYVKKDEVVLYVSLARNWVSYLSAPPGSLTTETAVAAGALPGSGAAMPAAIDTGNEWPSYAKKVLEVENGKPWSGEDSIDPYNTWGRPDPTFDWARWLYGVDADTGLGIEDRGRDRWWRHRLRCRPRRASRSGHRLDRVVVADGDHDPAKVEVLGLS